MTLLKAFTIKATIVNLINQISAIETGQYSIMNHRNIYCNKTKSVISTSIKLPLLTLERKESRLFFNALLIILK